jgi:putative restriction endonuclease
MKQIEIREIIMRDLEMIFSRKGFVTREDLSDYKIDGQPFKLVDQSRGIWNPQFLDSTLSIISDPNSHYRDNHRDDGLIEYAYQKGNIEGVNAKMRVAMANADPIILLTKIAPGIFVPTMPVYVVGDDMNKKRFLVAVDESLAVLAQNIGSVSPFQRKYAQALVKRRLHQPEFRGRVLRAYGTKCAVCSLAHGELLDAAHIFPDAHPDGHPVITNGLALCKIHHSAYDKNFLGISPDYKVKISERLLAEVDGPMLKHGLQEMNGRTIALPESKSELPSKIGLDFRFKQFEESA